MIEKQVFLNLCGIAAALVIVLGGIKLAISRQLSDFFFNVLMSCLILLSGVFIFSISPPIGIMLAVIGLLGGINNTFSVSSKL